MLRRLLPAVSMLRNLPGLFPRILRPVVRISTGRKLVLAGLVTIAVASAVWWWTGEWQAAVLAVGLATAVMLAVLMVELLARRLSRSHAKAWELEESKASSIQEQRESWVEQVRQLRQMGVDPSAVPLYLLIGESGGGKTSSLKHAELNYSFGREPVVGDGGTRNCLLHFTNDAWVVDTAGRYVISGQLDESGDEDHGRQVDEAEWLSFLGRLRRFRPRAPINGVVVSIPADALVDDDADARLRKAMLLRKALNELRVRLEMSFPVTVMITKADRLGGFSEYFDGMREWRDRRQLLGWSPRDESAAFEAGPFRTGFEDLLSGFRRRCLDIAEAAGPDASPDRLRRIRSFPEEFAGIEEALESYLTTMLAPDRYFGKLHFRGFFLTSSLQEGMPAFRACEELLGRSIDEFGFTGKRERSLFVHDFYAEKVFREAGMVAATSRRKRRARLVNRVGLAATIALLAVGGLLVARNHRELRAGILPTVSERDGGDVDSALLALVERVRRIPPSSAPERRDPPAEQDIEAVSRLGETIAGIETGDLADLGWFDLLSRGKRDEMLADLRRLHADRTSSLVFGSMAHGLASQAETALCDPAKREDLFAALVVVAAANYGSTPPCGEGEESIGPALRIAAGSDDESAPHLQTLAEEYRRAVEGDSDSVKAVMQQAIGLHAVTTLAGIENWHPVDEGCRWSNETAGVIADIWRRVLVADEAWKALETAGWTDRIGAEADRIDAFYDAVATLEGAIEHGGASQIPALRSMLATELDIQKRLRQAAGATDALSVRPIDDLVARIEASQSTALPGLMAEYGGSGSWFERLRVWIDLGETTSELSEIATGRRDALRALQELQTVEAGEDLLVECHPGIEEGRTIDLRTSGSAFRTALSDFHEEIAGFVARTESDDHTLHDVAESMRGRAYQGTVHKTGASILAALNSPEDGGAEGPLHAWRDHDPIRRIECVVIPFTTAIAEWKKDTLVADEQFERVVDRIDGQAVVMLERFERSARKAIASPENETILEWSSWIEIADGDPPTESQIATGLRHVLEHYDQCLGFAGDAGLPSPEQEHLPGLAEELARLQMFRSPSQKSSVVGHVESLVELAKRMGNVPEAEASWDEWSGWWKAWEERRALLIGLRAVEGEPTVDAPRSIVGDRVREIATALESRLRWRLGERVGVELERLSERTPRVFLFDGQGGDVEQIHKWFESLDEFEERLGHAVFADGAGSGVQDGDRVTNGQPIAIVDAETWEWLEQVREWRTFLYGDGAPSERTFAERSVVLTLDPDDWPFRTYLNLRIGERRMLRFNARKRSLRAEDVLQIEHCEVADSVESGHEVDDGDHAPIALLAELHRTRDARRGFVLRVDEERAIGLTVEFDGDVRMPERIPGRFGTGAVARGR